MQIPLLGALALLHAPVPALLFLAASTAAGVAGDLIFDVLVQRHVPSQERGRAFGLLFWCMALGQLAGAALGLGVSTAAAVPALFWVSAGVLPLACGALFYYVRGDSGATAQPIAAVA